MTSENTIVCIDNNCNLINELLLIKKWGETTKNYHWLHEQSFFYYKKLNHSIMIPIIIFTTLSGTINILLPTIDSNYDKINIYIQILSGCLSMIAAILTTIYNFLKIPEIQEKHFNNSFLFDKISRMIDMELILINTNKKTYSTLEEFMKVLKTEIDRLMELSPPIPIFILNKLNIKIKKNIELINKTNEIQSSVIECLDVTNSKNTFEISDILDIEKIKKDPQKEKLETFRKNFLL